MVCVEHVSLGFAKVLYEVSLSSCAQDLHLEVCF